MLSIRSVARTVAMAFALALTAAPIAANAEGRHAGAESKKEHNFPMTAEAFNKALEQRITRTRDRLTKAMNEHKVPAAKQAEIKKDFETGAAAIRVLAQRVQKDGTVTKEEAKEVRVMSKELKKQMRKKFMPAKAKDDKVAA